MNNDKVILHLVLKSRWYEMQEKCEKTEEYRDMTPYWISRILLKRPTHVCFHRGYTNTTFTKKVDSIDIGYGRPDWGAPRSRQVIIIKHSI